MNISRSKGWTAERGEEGRRNRSSISSQSAALYTGLHVFSYAEAHQNLAFLLSYGDSLMQQEIGGYW